MRLWMLIIAAIILSFISLFIGAIDIKPSDLLDWQSEETQIFLISRVPRLMAIILAGIGMSIAGLIMQSLSRNKFVSPTTAGTLDAAKLGILISMLFFTNVTYTQQIIFSFVFALVGTLLFMQILDRIKFKDAIFVPLIGIMYGNILSSITTFFAYEADLLQNISSWLMGSFTLVISGRYELLYLSIPAVILAYLYANKFTVAGMGEDFAKNLGLSYKFVLNIGLILVAIIATTVVLTVGVIPFLGLIVPNIVSLYLGDNLRKTIPHTAVLGVVFLLICDILGRVIIYPYEIPVNVTVAVIGSAIFLIMLFRGEHMRNSTKLIILAVVAIICILLYGFYDIKGGFDYAFPRRMMRVGAMIVTGFAIAYSTVVFQTITHNRILTPSVMGLDSMYEVVQTLIYFLAGSMSIWVLNQYLNFAVAIGAMVLFALFLYRFLFRADKHPIYLLLLIGMILGTLLGSLVTFLQVLIDPVEYLSLQNRLFASFSNIKVELLYISIVILLIAFIYGYRILGQLDVMSLGRENAINLGINYDRLVMNVLILSSVLIATSTALVGPITFFGLIVANLSYQFLVTYKHSIHILGAGLMSVIALVGGQFIVEHVFEMSTTLSVIINFIGGIYFIYLLLKESRAAG